MRVALGSASLFRRLYFQKGGRCDSSTGTPDQEERDVSMDESLDRLFSAMNATTVKTYPGLYYAMMRVNETSQMRLPSALARVLGYGKRYALQESVGGRKDIGSNGPLL